MSEATIFAAALDKAAGDERAAYLAEACAGDERIRRRVEALLRAHAEPDDVLDSPQLKAGTVDYQTITERPGSRVGPYRLMEQIGEGGFGLVFVAEQQEPVKRKVALKLIKPGMDSRQVVARFEAERQALALMDHPNIAKVLDAGATDSGRPYFVMELVRGIPITEYCDQNQLSPRERLDLFITVCQAIQHAHQKGIIHRDIKPSNVLVTSHDGKPIAKVIDFGVAKAINQQLTERTIYTNFAQMVGTPLYMSPEQAEMSELDIDTRSDIYSLGVLLYELLTGTTPLEKKQLREAAYDEIRRLIREEEPPKPSTRLSSSSESLPSVAAQRKMEPAKLSKLVRGDLDWITMKALEKDRTRRYETANGMARDIQRYLSDEPVEACPPSASYRVRKFVQRNRRSVAAAGLMSLALIGGIIGTTFGLVRAERQRRIAVAAAEEERQAKDREAQQRNLAEERKQLAESSEKKAIAEKQIAEAVRTFLQRDLLQQADAIEQANAVRELGGGFETRANPTVKDLLDRAAVELSPAKIEAKFPGQPSVQASILRTVGNAYLGVGSFDKAVEFLTRASELCRATLGNDHVETLVALDDLGVAFEASGKLQQAIAVFEPLLASESKRFGATDPRTLKTLNDLAVAYRLTGKLAEATNLLERVRAIDAGALPSDEPDRLVTLRNLASAYKDAGRLPEAIALFEQVRDLQMKTLGVEHPQTLTTLSNLGSAYRIAGKLHEAIALFERVRDIETRTYSADHPERLITLNNLALAYKYAGNLPQAIGLYEQVRDNQARRLGSDHPETLATLHNLAVAYRTSGQPERALVLFRQAAEGIEKREFQHQYAGVIVGNLVDCLEQMQQFAEAETWRRKWLAVVKERAGAESPAYAAELAALGQNLLKQRKWTDAESVVRECLGLREKTQPDYWATFNAKSMLGEALLEQKKYTEAEPLLLAGYEGMQQRESKIPVNAKVRLSEALERLVRLCNATDKADDAANWQKRLDDLKVERPPAKP